MRERCEEQGTLHAVRDLRTEIKIAKGEDGKYKAQFYSIDQPGPPINVPLVTLQGTDVRFAAAAVATGGQPSAVAVYRAAGAGGVEAGAAKAPTKVMVIDKAEKPSAN